MAKVREQPASGTCSSAEGGGITEMVRVATEGVASLTERCENTSGLPCKSPLAWSISIVRCEGLRFDCGDSVMPLDSSVAPFPLSTVRSRSLRHLCSVVIMPAMWFPRGLSALLSNALAGRPAWGGRCWRFWDMNSCRELRCTSRAPRSTASISFTELCCSSLASLSPRTMSFSSLASALLVLSSPRRSCSSLTTCARRSLASCCIWIFSPTMPPPCESLYSSSFTTRSSSLSQARDIALSVPSCACCADSLSWISLASASLCARSWESSAYRLSAESCCSFSRTATKSCIVDSFSVRYFSMPQY
mmetsp:Transcript_105399/g.308117  ORF Transcript_105399/g.308117 Transcript_105399/m.308117 type:complete len:305 (+) Transcript_105399:417-1331(+)